MLDTFPWLWTCARHTDLPWIRTEGLVPLTGQALYLFKERREAFPSPDRLILRVAVSALQPRKLSADTTWRSWVEGQVTDPPAALIAWWARSSVCEASANTRRDLHTQVSRINPKHVWQYKGIIPPHAISCASDAGFYMALRSSYPRRLSAIANRLRAAGEVEKDPDPQSGAIMNQLFPARAFSGWDISFNSADRVSYSKKVGDKTVASWLAEYVGPQVHVQIKWVILSNVKASDFPLASTLGQSAGRFVYEKTYGNVNDFQADTEDLRRFAWTLGPAKFEE